MEQQTHTNCRYCGSKFGFYDSNCPNCGAQNSPVPESWIKTIGLRFWASLKSKQESVWADRLAALMPLHFLIALYTFYLGLKLGLLGSLGFFTVLISAFVTLFILMYYPDWYKTQPEDRKDNGLMYFVLLLLHIVVIFFLF